MPSSYDLVCVGGGLGGAALVRIVAEKVTMRDAGTRSTRLREQGAWDAAA